MTVNITSLKSIYTWAFKNRYSITRIFDSYSSEAKNPDPIRLKPHFDDMINFYYTLHEDRAAYNDVTWLMQKYPEEYASSRIPPGSVAKSFRKLVSNFQYDNDLILDYKVPSYSRYEYRREKPMILDFKRCDIVVTIHDYIDRSNTFKIGLCKKELYMLRKDQDPCCYTVSQLLALGAAYPSNSQLLHLIKTHYRSYLRSDKPMFKDTLSRIYDSLETPYQKEQCLLLGIQLFEPQVLKRQHAPLKDVINLANVLNFNFLAILEHVKHGKIPRAAKCDLPTFD